MLFFFSFRRKKSSRHAGKLAIKITHTQPLKKLPIYTNVKLFSTKIYIKKKFCVPSCRNIHFQFCSINVQASLPYYFACDCMCNTQYQCHQQVRAETISTMRVIGKFIGFVVSRLYSYDGYRNSLVDQKQMSIRNLVSCGRGFLFFCGECGIYICWSFNLSSVEVEASLNCAKV